MSCESDIVLTQKELYEFEKSKLNAFNGTLMLCGFYFITGVALFLLVNFTEFGKNYLYNKYLPFAITYIIGAIFIIVYLYIAIYNLEPKRDRYANSPDIICPDYWKLEVLNTGEISQIIDNNKTLTSNIITKINDNDIKYKCKIDKNITPLDSYNNELTQGYYKENTTREERDYLYKLINDSDEELKKYNTMASHTRGTEPDNPDPNRLSSRLESITTAVSEPENNIICNEVYPKYLEKLDKNTPEGNKYRCDYAKKCGISWTNIGCDE